MNQQQYSDLDELIVMHIEATARKVEELANHPKFRRGTLEQLRKYPYGRTKRVDACVLDGEV